MFKPKAKQNLIILAVSLFCNLHYITRTEVAYFSEMYYRTISKLFCHPHLIISCVRHIVITSVLWGIYEICVSQNTTIFGQQSLCLPTRVTCFDPYVCHFRAHNSKNTHWGRQRTGSRLSTHSDIKSIVKKSYANKVIHAIRVFFFLSIATVPYNGMTCTDCGEINPYRTNVENRVSS